jgi:hypothetical protein
MLRGYHLLVVSRSDCYDAEWRNATIDESRDEGNEARERELQD